VVYVKKDGVLVSPGRIASGGKIEGWLANLLHMGKSIGTLGVM